MLPSAVPLGAYETAPDAFVLTDSRGRVRMVNEAAGALLECDPKDAVGRRCWGIVGLRTLDGAPLCAAECAVRGSLGKNAPCVRQRAVRMSRSGTPHEVDVFTLKIESTGPSWGVLHMIVPVTGDDTGREPELPVPGLRGVNGLQRLTRRETEILRALAAGESTDGIAEDLCISLATVRNHIRAVLRKLEVNSRLEAVLIWVAQFR
jgi:DNA-binding CsgD family transcriptional regulator